jgi:Protein of unknown function (DUF2911)
MRNFLAVAALLLSTAVFSQSKLPAVDKSPMDMSYYPPGYPLLKIQDKATEPLVARVIYSRPQKNGRVVFGELLEYGKVWRLGANEATELELYQNVKIGGSKIKKGRYTLYCIPTEKKWTIIVNRDTDTWGAFKYDEKKNVAKCEVTVEQNTEVTEAFAMAFEKGNGCINLVIAWDTVKVTLPIYQ